MSLQKLMNLMYQWNEWNSAFLPSASCSSYVLWDQFPAHKVLTSEYFILCVFTTCSSENLNKVKILCCGFLSCDTMQSCRRTHTVQRQQASSKFWYQSTRLHGVTTQRTTIWTVTTIKTSKLTYRGPLKMNTYIEVIKGHFQSWTEM